MKQVLVLGPGSVGKTTFFRDLDGIMFPSESCTFEVANHIEANTFSSYGEEIYVLEGGKLSRKPNRIDTVVNLLKLSPEGYIWGTIMNNEITSHLRVINVLNRPCYHTIIDDMILDESGYDLVVDVSTSEGKQEVVNKIFD